jgi:hypothetical protein
MASAKLFCSSTTFTEDAVDGTRPAVGARAAGVREAALAVREFIGAREVDGTEGTWPPLCGG